MPKLVFPGECRSNCVASQLNHLKVFCESVRPALFFDVRAQFTPSKTNSATAQVPDHTQGNNPRINRITEPFRITPTECPQLVGVRFDRRRTRSIRNIVNHNHRVHPFWSEHRLNSGEGGALRAFLTCPTCLEQTECDRSQNGQRGGHICQS